MRYVLCGIGGSGMSALAQVLRHQGHEVAGSDRAFDQGGSARIRAALEAQGIAIFPQDGSAIVPCTAALIVSSAVEPTIPDVRAALDAGIPVRKRADLLAELFNGGGGIAIGGTSGKSTVTAMVGHILARSGKRPTVINGAVMLDAPGELGNVLLGDPALPVIEADESDGTIQLYRPAVGVVTNISLDHKPLPELRQLFGGFADACTLAVVRNADCPECHALPRPAVRLVTFGLDASATVRLTEIAATADGVAFRLDGHPCRLRQLGLHNAANAAAAAAAALAIGIDPATSAEALADFQGVERRLQTIGEANGILVIDDFAHNPDKLAAALAALRTTGRRLRVFWQPHGFGPTRFLRQGLVDAFVNGLGPDDAVVLPEIFYAGGTAAKDISSADLVADIAARGKRAHFAPDRQAAADWLLTQARPGDLIAITGARDPSLTDFARELLSAIDSSQ